MVVMGPNLLMKMPPMPVAGPVTSVPAGCSHVIETTAAPRPFGSRRDPPPRINIGGSWQTTLPSTVLADPSCSGFSAASSSCSSSSPIPPRPSLLPCLPPPFLPVKRRVEERVAYQNKTLKECVRGGGPYCCCCYT